MSNVARVAGQAANTLVKPLDVDEVFSTYLYTGIGSSQTITNGIDLDGEGGLVWFKTRARSSGDFYSNHFLYDSDRGLTGTDYLHSNTTDAEGSQGSLGSGPSFLTNGFTTGPFSFTNETYASWTFRKAPKFFDVVTYTGDGTAGRTVSHNLGSVPGCIIVKKYAGSGGGEPWEVYHRGVDSTAPEDYRLILNTGSARSDSNIRWNDTAPTSTEFTLGTSTSVNGSGYTYVAYLFAHNDGDAEFGPNGNADIIKCGSYTGDGGAGTTEVDLGFEPQWILVKASSAADNWFVIDNMRGWATHNNTANDAYLRVDNANAESTGGFLDITSTGFKTTLYSNVNVSGREYTYIAIRRPTAVPESATEVFAVDEGDGVGAVSAYTSGFPVDFAMDRSAVGVQPNYVGTRLLQGTRLQTDGTNAEASESAYYFDYMEGWRKFARVAGNYSWMWKRAPNFFDVVAYTGNGSKQTIAHNLGVAPEMMWIKVRSTTQHWAVYHPDLPGSGKFISLNNNWDGNNTNSNFWDGETPTSTTFSVGATGVNNNYVNGSPNTYIAYLFATLAGISKVGSVTHSGTTNVDCGFSAGSRFVLLKRTDATGDWYVWDSERGIVSGNDPYLLLNSTAAQVAVQDYINPLPSGFTITSNFDYGDYIFYAIA